MKGTRLQEPPRIRIDFASPAVVPRFAQLDGLPRRRSRRYRKVARFLLWELCALALFLGCLIGGTSPPLTRLALTAPFFYGILFAAAALALIPVFFFALPDRRDVFRRYR